MSYDNTPSARSGGRCVIRPSDTPQDVPFGELLTPEILKEAIVIEWEGFLDPDLPGGVTVDDIYRLYENTRQLEKSAKALCGMAIGASFGFGY